MRMPPAPLPDSMMARLDEAYRSRWEALLAVDEMVADVMQALNNTNLLDNTYVIFTSDNGYHIGRYLSTFFFILFGIVTLKITT